MEKQGYPHHSSQENLEGYRCESGSSQNKWPRYKTTVIVFFYRQLIPSLLLFIHRKFRFRFRRKFTVIFFLT